jgi:radical SAM protein with 4Fe4S-binding SPASM domain
LFIRIAYDASTRETYKKVHRVDDFQKLIETIKLLVEHKENNKKVKTLIGLKYLVSKINYNEITDATVQAKELGVDYIRFKALRNSKYEISKGEEDKANYFIEKSKHLSNKKFKVFGSVEKTHIKERCILNPLHPVIDYSGDLYMCAFFHHRKKSHRIGNIYKNSFQDIWYSKEHYEKFNKTKLEECCVYDCPLHKQNEIARKAIKEGGMHLEFI